MRFLKILKRQIKQILAIEGSRVAKVSFIFDKQQSVKQHSVYLILYYVTLST